MSCLLMNPFKIHLKDSPTAVILENRPSVLDRTFRLLLVFFLDAMCLCFILLAPVSIAVHTAPNILDAIHSLRM